jgi:excisionase family DNA binding protein
LRANLETIKSQPHEVEEDSNSSAANSQSPGEIITPDELALLLRLNRKTVYELLARREIPGARRIGRRYRISRDAVLDWLRGQDRVSRARSK